MKKTHKHLSRFISIVGTLLALFIGGYVMFALPIYTCIKSITAGTLTVTQFIMTVIVVFLASTVGGAIWCAFDILAQYVKNEKEYF